MTPTPEQPKWPEIDGRVDALLSGLKAQRMPDGKHFPSDAAAIISFAKWYSLASASALRDTTRAGVDREKLARWFCDNYSAIEDDESLFFIMAPRRETLREAGYRTADALIASGILGGGAEVVEPAPTEEINALSDKDDEEFVACCEDIVSDPGAHPLHPEDARRLLEILRRLKSPEPTAGRVTLTKESLVNFFYEGPWPNRYTRGYLGNSQRAADAIMALLNGEKV